MEVENDDESSMGDSWLCHKTAWESVTSQFKVPEKKRDIGDLESNKIMKHLKYTALTGFE